MSKLYFCVDTDTRKIPITGTGQRKMDCSFYYGNKDKSKLAISMAIEYPKGSDAPILVVKVRENLAFKLI